MKLVDLTMQLHHETEKAILVSDDGDRKKAKWLPKSQCEFSVVRDNIVEVTCPEWFAMDKGLI